MSPEQPNGWQIVRQPESDNRESTNHHRRNATRESSSQPLVDILRSLDQPSRLATCYKHQIAKGFTVLEPHSSDR